MATTAGESGGGRASIGDLPPGMAAYKPSLDINRDTVGGGASEGAEFVDNFLRRRSVADRALGGTGQFDDEADSKKLGTLAGVYLPCLQNILGIIFFIRSSWIVGVAGIGMGFFIVFTCCATTFLTAISMSAVATNGKVPAGGAYYMITRGIGPEFGAACGVLFYLATTIAACMYILGAIEVAQANLPPLGPGRILKDCDKLRASCENNGLPWAVAKFGTEHEVTFSGSEWPQGCCIRSDNEVRMLSVLLTLFMVSVVFVGIKFVARVGPAFLAICLIAVALILIGFWSVHTRAPVKIGDTGFVIDGLRGDNFNNNFGPQFTDKWHFGTLVALFFPSVTGIMAGSNRSGDLKDAQASIPRGTIGAIVTTSVLYLSNMVMWGAVASREALADEAGVSKIAAAMSPYGPLVAVGVFLSTVGAGLQSMTGAPRLLHAIAADGLIPFLNFLEEKTPGKEPHKCLALTWLIINLGIMPADLEIIVPLISMFFLLYYAGVNLACFLLEVLKMPNFRPRWQIYHWATSFLGFVLCIMISFFISIVFAVITLVLVVALYVYVGKKGKKHAWSSGCGLVGVRFTQARDSLLLLRRYPSLQYKNWRPQMLCFVNVEDEHITNNAVILLANQMKKGRGLTVISTVVEGQVLDQKEAREQANEVIHSTIESGEVVLSDGQAQSFCKTHNFPALSRVVVAANKIAGIDALMQCGGLGGLATNTVLSSFPERWREDNSAAEALVHIDRLAVATDMSHLVLRGNVPNEEQHGTVDVWWVQHDGGLLLLLPMLLAKHRVWKMCSIRLFAVTAKADKTENMQEALNKVLYDLRMDATAEVVVMPSIRDAFKASAAKKWEESGKQDGQQSFMRRLPAAMELNNAMKSRSADAKLVITNMPHAQSSTVPRNYVDFAEHLTQDVPTNGPCILVSGTGKQLISAYN